jgi:hypothetical protein
LVERDPARYALSAAFKACPFGALSDRSKPQGSVEEVAFGPNAPIEHGGYRLQCPDYFD